DGIRRGRAYLSRGPVLTFRARGSDGAETSLPGDELRVDDGLDLTVEIEGLQEPGTLWFVTSGWKTALGAPDPGTGRMERDGLDARSWWRLELRKGSAPHGDMLALTNPVYVAS